MERYRIHIIMLFTAVAVFGFYSMATLPLKTDITEILPQDLPYFQKYQRFARKLTDISPIFFHIPLTAQLKGFDKGQGQAAGQVKHPAEPLLKMMDNLAQALVATKWFKEVVYKIDYNDFQGLQRYFLAQAADLWIDADLDALRSRLTPQAIRHKLAQRLHEMGSFISLLTKDTIAVDPVGLSEIYFARLKTMSQREVFHGYYITPDKRFLVLAAHPHHGFQDAKANKKMNRQVEAIIEQLNRLFAYGAITFYGGHIHADQTEQAIRHDISWSISASLLLILVIFLIGFRSMRALFLAFIPVLFSFLGPAILFRCLGYAPHILIFAFGAVLNGVSIDYSIHLLNEFRHCPGEDALSRVKTVLKRVRTAIVLGALTTVAGFLACLMSEFQILEHLGLYIASGIVVALLVTLFLLPALLLYWPIKLDHAGKSQVNRPVQPIFQSRVFRLSGLVAGICLIVTLGLGLFQIRFQPDIESLALVRPPVRGEVNAAAIDQLAKRVLIVCEAKDLESALQVNDQVYHLLFSAYRKGQLTRLFSLSPFRPAKATRQRSRQVLAASGLNQSLIQVKAIGEALGYSPEAFSGFERVFSLTQPVAKSDGSIMTANRLFRGLDQFLVSSDGRYSVASIMVSHDPAALKALEGQIKSLAEPASASISFLSAGHMFVEISQVLKRDFFEISLIGGLAVLLLVFLGLRSVKWTLVAFIPVSLGLLGMIGLMGWLNIPFNILNIISVALILGLGVDYGIFLVYAIRQSPGQQVGHVIHSLTLAGLTTIVAFLSIIPNDFKLLNDLGEVMAIGISGTLASAWLLAQWLNSRKRG